MGGRIWKVLKIGVDYNKSGSLLPGIETEVAVFPKEGSKSVYPSSVEFTTSALPENGASPRCLV